MEDQARIQPTLGHYMGGCQILVSLPASAVPSLKYRVVFRSVFDPAISSTVSAQEVKRGVLQCTSPEHGRPDVTSVSIHTDSPQNQYIAATQFQFQDRISIQLCATPPLSAQDFKFLVVSMLSLPIEEVLRNAAALDNLMVTAILQEPPLINSIDVKSLFEGCRLVYNNDKANLFHFASEFGLARFADILTNQLSGMKYSLKAELFRRTSAGCTPLAIAKRNTADCGRQVKAVLADAIAEFNESKHDKGRSAKKEKMRSRAQSCPNRLPKSIVLQDVPMETLESEDGASPTVQKQKPKRKFWSKKTSKSQLKSNACGTAQASASRQAMGPEGVMYCVAVVAMSSGSDSDSGVKRMDKTTIQYFWNNALAFVQATSDFSPPSKSGKTKMLPLKIGDVAVVVKRGEGLKSGEVYGLVNNTEVGVFPLSHVKRITMTDAQAELKYHCTRKTSSLPQLERIPTEQLATPCSKDEAVMSEYEVMEKPSGGTIVQEQTVHWYQVTHQAEITKDFKPASSLPDYADYLTLQACDVVNVICMPDHEDWALVEHCGRVGRALHAVLRVLAESAASVQVKPTYMDPKLGTKPIQPGDLLAVGITYANELKISAVVYGDEGGNGKQVQALAASRAASGKPEVIYDSPETSEGLRTAALLDGATDCESSVSTQGDVGTGFDCGSDTSVQSLAGSESDKEKDTTTPERAHNSGASGTTPSAQQSSRKRSSSAQSAEGNSAQHPIRSGPRAATLGLGHREMTHSLQLGLPSAGSPPGVQTLLAKRSPDVYPKPLHRAQSVDTALDSDPDLKKGAREQRLAGVMSSTSPKSLHAGEGRATGVKAVAQKLADSVTLSQSERCLVQQEKTGHPSSRKTSHRMSLRLSSTPDRTPDNTKPRPASISGLTPSSSHEPPPLSPKPTRKTDGNKAATLPAGILPSVSSTKPSRAGAFSAAQQSAANACSTGMLPPGSRGPVGSGGHSLHASQQYPTMKIDLPGTGSLRKR